MDIIRGAHVQPQKVLTCHINRYATGDLDLFYVLPSLEPSFDFAATPSGSSIFSNSRTVSL